MRTGWLVGWALLGIAALLASADAVLAFVPGEHAGIAARDIYLLVAGKGLPMAAALLSWPAWVFIAPLGLLVLWLSRPRRRRYRFRTIR